MEYLDCGCLKIGLGAIINQQSPLGNRRFTDTNLPSAMTTRRSPILVASILLIAASARFYRIDAQSLWSDEGSSVAQALRDIPAIAGNSALDIHPPLYYILLHFWV